MDDSSLGAYFVKSRVNLSFVMVGSQDCIALTGGNTPIIFLHGMTSTKETWSNVIHQIAIATGRKAYAYDARNHGDSEWSDEFDYEIMRDDLFEFMDGLHIRRAILIGHSMGGHTAMLSAAKKPQRVEKLIVEDISPKDPVSNIRIKAQSYLEQLKYVIEQIPPEIRDLKKAKAFVHEYLQEKIPEDQRSSRHGTTDGSTLPLSHDGHGKFKWKVNLEVIGEKCLDGSSVDINGVYPGPALILYGTKSPFGVYGDSEFIRRLFPGSQFSAVEGATHQVHLEYEETFVKVVIKFINKVG